MDIDERERLIDAYYDAVDEESYEAFDRLFTADSRHVRPGQGVLRGGAAVREYYETERDATETTHDVKRLVHDDAITLCLVEVRGTGTEGPFSRPVVGEFTFDAAAGRISSYRVFRGYAGETDATSE